MTRAQAFALLSENVTGLDADVDRALAVLRPAFEAKPRKAAQSPAVREILRNLKRPESWGDPVSQEARYLDTFGEHGSPEREAQRLRLQSLQRGPSAEAFGEPEPPAWEDEQGRPLDWTAREALRKDWDAQRSAWRLSAKGQAFERAREIHEARTAQFAYQPLKGKHGDDERRVYMEAVLARTTIQELGLALEVAA
jgi:hypothetical protein